MTTEGKCGMWCEAKSCVGCIPCTPRARCRATATTTERRCVEVWGLVWRQCEAFGADEQAQWALSCCGVLLTFAERPLSEVWIMSGKVWLLYKLYSLGCHPPQPSGGTGLQPSSCSATSRMLPFVGHWRRCRGRSSPKGERVCCSLVSKIALQVSSCVSLRRPKDCKMAHLPTYLCAIQHIRGLEPLHIKDTRLIWAWSTEHQACTGALAVCV